MATCTPHGVETNLSCRTCGTPVCADCAVRTVMGVTCAEHSGSAKKEAVTALAPRAERSGPGGKRLVIGGAVLALLIAGVVFLRPSGGGDGDGGTLSAAWTPLPAAGLAARTGMAFVSTGEGMIVWGGSGLNDGAVLQLPAVTWKPL